MKKLLRTTKFPEEFETKVSMSKVKLDVMLPWISQKITQYLGFEDEVVVGYVEATLRAFFLSPSPHLLDDRHKTHRNPSARTGCIRSKFCSSLWWQLFTILPVKGCRARGVYGPCFAVCAEGRLRGGELRAGPAQRTYEIILFAGALQVAATKG